MSLVGAELDNNASRHFLETFPRVILILKRDNGWFEKVDEVNFTGVGDGWSSRSVDRRRACSFASLQLTSPWPISGNCDGRQDKG